MNYPKFYTETKIEDGKYREIAVKKELRFELTIKESDDTIFKVTHTGAYGQIKITNGTTVFTCDNPFSYYFDKLKDKRPNFTIKELPISCVAVSEDKLIALDMRNMKFSLTPEKMAKLHNDVYIPDKTGAYWIELNH